MGIVVFFPAYICSVISWCILSVQNYLTSCGCHIWCFIPPIFISSFMYMEICCTQARKLDFSGKYVSIRGSWLTTVLGSCAGSYILTLLIHFALILYSFLVGSLSKASKSVLQMVSLPGVFCFLIGRILLNSGNRKHSC